MARVSDILRKKLESVEDTTSIQEVAKKMKDTNVSSLVVVDTNCKPVGSVTFPSHKMVLPNWLS